MNDFKFHVKPIGLFDMLHFKKMVPARQKALAEGSLECITAERGANKLAALFHPAKQVLTISDIYSHGENAKTYLFSGEGLAPFRAGQYLSFKLQIGGAVLTRPYSITSSPKEAYEGKYTITVKRAEGGFASGWILDNWKVGDKVTCSGPEGIFYYEPLRDAKHVIALAGGCGITPFISMAAAIRDGFEDFKLTILYGSRKEEDILHKAGLEEIGEATDKVNIINILSDEQKEGYAHGFITAQRIKEAAGNEQCSLFVCGPCAMYEFLERELNVLGYERKFIRREVYVAPQSPKGIPGYEGDLSKELTLTVKAYDSIRKVPMKADETVLVALERSGIDAPSRCRGGECGFCRSRLEKGDVFVPKTLDYRRMADAASGYIHPCSCYPLTDLAIEIWPE